MLAAWPRARLLAARQLATCGWLGLQGRRLRARAVGAGRVAWHVLRFTALGSGSPCLAPRLPFANPLVRSLCRGLLEESERPKEQPVELHADFTAVAKWKVGGHDMPVGCRWRPALPCPAPPCRLLLLGAARCLALLTPRHTSGAPTRCLPLPPPPCPAAAAAGQGGAPAAQRRAARGAAPGAAGVPHRECMGGAVGAVQVGGRGKADG